MCLSNTLAPGVSLIMVHALLALDDFDSPRLRPGQENVPHLFIGIFKILDEPRGVEEWFRPAVLLEAPP